MANEVQVQMSLRASKNGASVTTGSISENITMSGTDMLQTTQNIASSGWNAISFGSITGVPSKVFIKNLDSTNYVELATDNAGANKFIKIGAGGTELFSPSSATIYAKANSADIAWFIVATEA